MHGFVQFLFSIRIRSGVALVLVLVGIEDIGSGVPQAPLSSMCVSRVLLARPCSCEPTQVACLHVCMYVCVYGCVYVCVHVYMCVGLYVYIDVHMCIGPRLEQPKMFSGYVNKI